MFSTDLTIDYMLSTPALPVTPLTGASFADLVKARLDTQAQEKDKAQQKVFAAQSRFRCLTVRLLADLIQVGEAYPGLLSFVGHPAYDCDAYGITIVRHNKQGVDRCRIVMSNADTPGLVRFEKDTDGIPRFVFDLESNTPHGSGEGFARPYSSLLEDLASWVAAAPGVG